MNPDRKKYPIEMIGKDPTTGELTLGKQPETEKNYHH